MSDKIDIIDYYPTEKEITQVLERTDWRKLFSRDYISSKGNLGRTVDATDANTADIVVIKVRLDDVESRLTTAEGQIVELEIRITTAEEKIVDIDARLVTAEDTLYPHVAATQAHGASGNIVGDTDFATESIGGVVLRSRLVPYAPTIVLTPPSLIGAAPATYSQAYAQQQTDAINALIADANSTQNGFDLYEIEFNRLIDEMKIAKMMTE